MLSPLVRHEPRSLSEALADLRAKLKSLPMNDKRRGPITQQIVRLEDELDRKGAR
jgi:uncharacterized alpha-E superfamily protein